MTRTRIAVALAIAAVVVVVAVASVGALTRRPTAAPTAIPWTALANATYPTSLVRSGVTLHDGLYDVPAAPGSASRTIIRLADIAAFGDLDADAASDAAVVLVGSGGGTGTFVELVAVHNAAGTPEPIATTLLGDRVLVREVRVTDGQILVRVRTRGATDPLSLRTRETTRHYILRAGGLVLLDETEADVSAAPAGSFTYAPQRIDIAAGGSREVSGSLAPGDIASYVVHARAGDSLDLFATSEFDNAVLSVSGLADATPLVSRRDYQTRTTVTLPSEQDYAVKVVSLAGYALPFTLQVQLRAGAVPSATPRPTAVPLPSRTPPPAPTSPPGSLLERALGVASAPAQTFARSRPPTWGVAVIVPSQNLVYAENADVEVPTASVVKVLIMLTALEEARQDHRPPSEAELALLWPMITESDNDATSELWEDVGRGQAVSSYLKSIGVVGFTPDPTTFWGVSFVSARAMATALAKLLSGDILDESSRALATKLLESVIPEQRWGVTAGTDAEKGDRVGIKDGWYPGEEGWRVNSAGIVHPRTGAPYAIAVVSDGRPSWKEGIDTIEGIAAPLNGSLRGG